MSLPVPRISYISIQFEKFHCTLNVLRRPRCAPHLLWGIALGNYCKRRALMRDVARMHWHLSETPTCCERLRSALYWRAILVRVFRTLRLSTFRVCKSGSQEVTGSQAVRPSGHFPWYVSICASRNPTVKHHRSSVLFSCAHFGMCALNPRAHCCTSTYVHSVLVVPARHHHVLFFAFFSFFAFLGVLAWYISVLVFPCFSSSSFLFFQRSNRAQGKKKLDYE